MSFLDTAVASKIAALKALHYDFPRANDLRAGISWMITDYWAKASAGQTFEARGLMVTGPSRIGKTGEIRHQLEMLNDGSTVMPDGRPARIVSVMLKGTMSWKDLGVHTLREGFGLPTSGRMTQREIWDMVGFHAREQGVHGIHYDECQHIFPKKSAEGRAMILDSFKSLLKKPDWPLMLILSGVDELAGHINSEEQLAYLLRPVPFREISLTRDEDVQELNRLCFAYADTAGFDFTPLSSMDFYRRLSCACSYRWGLVIELLIDALVEASRSREVRLDTRHFCRAFTDRTSLPTGYSPFSVEDFEPLFKASKIFDLWSEKKGRGG
ncbi:AAA domain-containing protein [Celeribacter baekdonensis]|uniref:AAA domain-containing protein n=1 Tax=Celeribacter baekdonensis TaxID=875171 RepID=A0A1G7UC49_9RHOB|nr:ATP-binding protein [Celeribacter baekdonensis]SDG45053.1 AAA domain-containing protein [Celeribacter baekdonensis]